MHTDGHDAVVAGSIPGTCPANRVFDLVGHKWTLGIIHVLEVAGGPVRFRQIQRTIGPITPKELTKRLRELERAGLVERTVFAEVPPRVEYALTPLGLTLSPALAGLHEWASEHADRVDVNRARFDERVAIASRGPGR